MNPSKGARFNPASKWIIQILRKNRAVGIGQSSWGPTIYAFAENEEKAVLMKDAMRDVIGDRAEMFIAKADNFGGYATTSEKHSS